MSHASPRSSSTSASTLTGFSTGSGIGIIVAALVTGGLIALYNEAVGLPFLVLFTVASIVVATFVNPRGLFLTVASIPLLYTFFMLFTGVLIAYFQLPEGQTSLGRTSAVLILYPLTQYFLVLLFVTLGSLLIALLRLRLLKKQNDDIRAREERQRRSISATNRRTRREASRSRQRSSGTDTRVTVEELLARRAERQKEKTDSGSSRGLSRRLSDDLYDS
ncbi:DUF6542 domain-containing protein [Corynebacterium appendicis]|uniref:DUF6542 domain-containing protein n=1 Tax=Corynebacterium appendicis TaxID=163202 RepID=UPI00254C493E|nr:DUF6542 domain-containing protein [Corynebacterium appendicis]MDK8625884.1 hypothetical protein [Corynebacterium appendicis]